MLSVLIATEVFVCLFLGLCSEKSWKYIFFLYLYLSIFPPLNWKMPSENVKTGHEPLLVTLLLVLLELKYINFRNMELVRIGQMLSHFISQTSTVIANIYSTLTMWQAKCFTCIYYFH